MQQPYFFINNTLLKLIIQKPEMRAKQVYFSSAG